jgi:hypothetical protein
MSEDEQTVGDVQCRRFLSLVMLVVVGIPAGIGALPFFLVCGLCCVVCGRKSIPDAYFWFASVLGYVLIFCYIWGGLIIAAAALPVILCVLFCSRLEIAPLAEEGMDDQDPTPPHPPPIPQIPSTAAAAASGNDQGAGTGAGAGARTASGAAVRQNVMSLDADRSANGTSSGVVAAAAAAVAAATTTVLTPHLDVIGDDRPLPTGGTTGAGLSTSASIAAVEAGKTSHEATAPEVSLAHVPVLHESHFASPAASVALIGVSVA